MMVKAKYINVGGRLIDLDTPKVMGVLNITPDSFYTGSRFNNEKDILAAAKKMVEDGADFLDIGGYSSRPGAENIEAAEEKERVLKAIRLVSAKLPEAIISIDTFRADIAREAVCDCGAHIINDISGGESDKMMFPLVQKLNIPYIMMHMKGTPQNMQHKPEYDDVVADLLRWFGQRITGLKGAGVKDIIIDPGFGFGKTTGHNFEILRHLGDFGIAGLPVMVGFSRKSMIWKTLDTTPEDALNGTTVLNTIALLKGANILRVHDVKEAVEAVKLVEKIRKERL
jgi:dihydropteroate synthase